MTRFQHKTKAFTLIEIIVVLIILGVLASIAIPSYFDWINRSTAAKAYEMIKEIKNQMGACIAVRGNDAVGTCTSLMMTQFVDSEFYILNLTPYGVSGSGQTRLYLERRTGSGETGSGNVFEVIFDPVGNIITCRGYGSYNGLC